MDSMKTTIDIPESELEEAMSHAGARTKRAAVVAAIVEFNRRRRLERLAKKLGTFDGFISSTALAKLRSE